MKTPFLILSRTVSTLVVCATALWLAATSAQAVNFAGNGNTGFGGSVGNGTLSVTDDGTNITVTITLDGANMGGNGVALYIDTGTGGFASTAGFNDASDGGHSVVSGYSSSGQSVMTFTNGFSPSYAVSIGDGYPSLYKLANGGNGSFTYLTGEGTTPYSFTFPAADLGLTPGVPAAIRIFGSLISQSGYRSTEAIAGNDYGPFGQGWYPFTQTAYVTYNFDAPPTPSYPVTFSVDMTEQIVLGNFNPANGDTVYAEGTFQTNAWTGFQLTPTVGNTNIYTGTYLDYNPTNTAEQFKFGFISVANNSNGVETVDNRPFTLQAGGQSLPLVYFNDVFPSPSATTNYLTFTIDMGPQLYLGHFNPANGDQIQVLGTFENPRWTVGGFILTNNPSGSDTNIYSGTIADGNYPGSFENYKFVIVSDSNTNYESGNNRDFFTPTGSYTFPLAYFNGVTNVYSTPVTFQVDMTVPLAIGEFNPANGDTAGCAGTFQTNSFGVGASGFTLTNNPTAVNSNVYSGTYIDHNPPGTGEQYKFVINTNGGGTAYESPVSTGGQNRAFVLADTAMTNPLVFWDDENPNQVVLTSTTITFTVNMTNAVDVFGNPFDQANDVVMVDGNFTSPQWQVMNHATDPTMLEDYGNYIMQSTTTDLLYSLSFTIPPGSPIAVTYKYGIFHNVGPDSNTNVDNEAPFNDNHLRYVRSSDGTYNFPVDTFGIQRTNAADATEPLFGQLTIGAPADGQFPINWLGGIRGVYLQTTTNLVSGVWQNLSATGGGSSTNWNQTAGSAFFRLVQP